MKTNTSFMNFLGLYNILSLSNLIQSAEVNTHTGLLSEYTVKGFAKSGSAKVVLHDDNSIRCHTRYDREVFLAHDAECTSVEDLRYTLAVEALYWYASYQISGYTIDEDWLKIWIEFDLVEKIEKVEYRIK